MRKERKEILKKMMENSIMEECDRQLGCGYTAHDFGLEDPFQIEHEKLYAQLAATYDMDADM